MMTLKAEYGLHDQDTSTMALDAFFDHRRGSYTLQQCLAHFAMKYDDAKEKARATGADARAAGREA